MARPVAAFEESFRKYGDLYSANHPLFGREVVVNHPQLIKQIFTGDPNVFHGGEANQVLSPVMGRSVIMLDGVAHRRQRKLLMPPFHPKRLSVYAKTMRAITNRIVDEWPRGKRFALLPSMQRITFDVILETIFGLRRRDEIEALRDGLSALMERIQSPFGMIWMLPALQRDLGPLTGWAGHKRAIEAADQAIYQCIAKAREEGPAARQDILALLLAAVDEEGRPMTDQELRDELVTLLLAGHETTATALCWAFEEILRRPDVLNRVLSEVDGLPAAEPWPDKLPYLDATIREVLRLRPIIPLLVRKLTAPVTMRGFELPADTYLVPCIYNVQRHPDYWPEPNEFRPQRFIGQKPNPYAWLPFGGGARHCIGMAFALYEMRMVLATVLARVSLHVSDRPPSVSLRSFTFAPKGGAPVIVEDRTSAAT